MTDEDKAHAAADQLADDEKRYPDPYGLYRLWFSTLENGWDETDEGSISPAELGELWKRWFEERTGRGDRAVEMENGFVGVMDPLWTEMAEDISAQMLSGETLPEDPLKFFMRWYDATSQKWSKIADDLLKKDEVLASNSRFFETYARSHRELHRASEEGLENLRAPTSSDIARVARLVVGVENKVDQMEEAFEEFTHGYSEAVGNLEERMGRLEGKVDRLLAALEKTPDPAPGG